jgi:hypothetical protein
VFIDGAGLARRSTDQPKLGVVAKQRRHGMMLPMGFLQMVQILPQGVVVELDQKRRSHRRVVPADVVNQLTFVVHERTTFSVAENSGDQSIEIGRLAAQT